MRRFLTPRWLLRHLAVFALVVAFLGLGWWQLRRAQGGNSLSFGYAVEWPVFALFVIFVWVREMRGELRGTRPVQAPPVKVPEPDLLISVPAPTRRTTEAGDDPGDPQLRAYNQYLAWLNANPQAKPGDYPGAQPNDYPAGR